MKKIGVITNEYPPDRGGVGRFMSELASVFPTDAVTIFAPSTKQRQSKKDIIEYTFSNKIWPHWLPLLITILFHYRHYTYFIVSSPLPLGTITWLLSFVLPIKYCIIAFGMDVAQLRKASWKHRLAKKIFSRAHIIIAISSFTKQLVKTYVDSDYNIVVVHPRPYCAPETTKQREPILLPSDFKSKKIFLSVGRLVQRKNFFRLMDIAEKFNRESEFRLVIVGNGPEFSTLSKRAKNIPTVCMLSDTTDEELAWLYAHSRAVLFVPLSDKSGDVEGFGITALEASAFSKPVIASQEGGVPDAVEHNVSGILVDPRNIQHIYKEIISFLDNDERVNFLGFQGRKRYEREFSQTALTQQITEMFTARVRAPVSVIIPAYQAERTIEQTIRSIQNQTRPPQEIIIVNDGSTDATQHIIDRFSNTCIIIRQTNQGGPTARNNGAKYATQPYILFLDADIHCKPDMIEIQLRALEGNPDAHFAYSGFRFGWKKFTSYPFDANRLTQHNYIHTSSIIRKESFPGFDPSLGRHQDWDLWLTMIEQGKKGVFIPRILYEIQLERSRISHWIPSFAYHLPFGQLFFPELKKYRDSEQIIRTKHGI